MKAHDPKTLQTLVARFDSPELELAFKPMFGGVMAYTRGRPFVSLSDMGLALKLDPASRDALLALPGSRPLRYASDDPPSKTYTLAPDAMLADDALRTWIERSAAFVASQPAKPRKSRG